MAEVLNPAVIFEECTTPTEPSDYFSLRRNIGQVQPELIELWQRLRGFAVMTVTGPQSLAQQALRDQAYIDYQETLLTPCKM